MASAVRRRTGAGASCILGLLTFLTGTLPATAGLAAAAATSLAGQGKPLQLREVHPRQPDGRLEVLLVLRGALALALLVRLLGQQPVRLPRCLDLRLPHLARLAFEAHQPGHVELR